MHINNDENHFYYLISVVFNVECEVCPEMDVVCMWEDTGLIQSTHEPTHRYIIYTATSTLSFFNFHNKLPPTNLLCAQANSSLLASSAWEMSSSGSIEAVK